MTRRCWLQIGLAAIPPLTAQTIRKEPMPNPTPKPDWQDAQKRIVMAKAAVDAQKTFGARLLRAILESTPQQNVFISPLSVFLALEMAGNGAAGATRAAMWKTLAISQPDDAANASAQALLAALNTRSGAELAIANALWADQHAPLSPDFAKLCENIFGARAASLKFSDPAAADTINAWIKEKTNGKIAEIVTPQIVAQAAVILTNAVYFAGKWQAPFSASQTQPQPFHLSAGGGATVSMMHRERLPQAYRSGKNFEGALLRYKGSDVFFYALLPEQGTTPRQLLASLDMEHLAEGPAEFDLDLKLPRFALDYSAGLGGYLKTLGMEAAFDPHQADFTPMGSNTFYISDVLHKTRLEVDEEGTVAAAATAVIMSATAARQQSREVKTLVFDRPFAVLIADARTGAVLFAGAIEEPRSG